MGKKEYSEKDTRFSHVARDFKFKRIPRKHVKVKVDKRFESMLKDEKFQINRTTDRRGKPLGKLQTEDLKRLYDLSDSSISSESEEKESRSNEDISSSLDYGDTESSDEDEMDKKPKRFIRDGDHATAIDKTSGAKKDNLDAHRSIHKNTNSGKNKELDECRLTKRKDDIVVVEKKENSKCQEKKLVKKPYSSELGKLSWKRSDAEKHDGTYCNKASKICKDSKPLSSENASDNNKGYNFNNSTIEVKKTEKSQESDPHDVIIIGDSSSDITYYSDAESEKNKKISSFLKANERADFNVECTTDDSDEILQSEEHKRRSLNSGRDRARGKVKSFIDSSCSEDETSSDEEVESDIDIHDWGELDHDAERTDEATNRLAVCRMDWDKIKAVDLMVLFNSFLPTGGVIKSITIYPSDYGLERMKQEEEKGPAEFKEFKVENEEDNEKINKEQMEKLRKYQLNRLNYYYAVIVCDSKETANVLYSECDGLEYESSAVKLDLRFIPDNVTFTQNPKDSCKELPDPATYKPSIFQTTALTSSKVDLTWDQNDPDREDFVKSLKSGNIDESQMEKYVACSSDTEDDDESLKNDSADEKNEKEDTEESSVKKFKTLLSEIQLKENERKKKTDDELNMEVTWDINLENKAKEEITIKKNNITPFEEYLEKKKDKKKKKKQKKKAKDDKEQKRYYEEAFSDDDIPSDVDLNDPYFKEELDKLNPRKIKKMKRKQDSNDINETKEAIKKKAELELLMLDDKTDNNHSDLKNIQEGENTENKKKRKRKRRRRSKKQQNIQEDNFKINVNDERFSALYSSHHFNIDPTDPHYRPTKAVKAINDEKLRRRAMNLHKRKH